MHQAASFQVEGGAVVERQRAGSVEVVDQRLAGLGRDVAVDEQAQVVVDQRRRREPMRVRLELTGHVGEVRLARIAAHRQAIAPVEALEQRASR